MPLRLEREVVVNATGQNAWIRLGAVVAWLLGGMLMMGGMSAANAGPKLPDPAKAGVAERLIVWIVATPLRTTSQYGRRAKTSAAISNSHRLAG
jgi:hypothetical protein